MPSQGESLRHTAVIAQYRFDLIMGQAVLILVGILRFFGAELSVKIAGTPLALAEEDGRREV